VRRSRGRHILGFVFPVLVVLTVSSGAARASGGVRAGAPDPARPTAPATTIVRYPRPYRPPYNTLAQIFASSSIIMLGTVGPRTSEPLGPSGGVRSIVNGYPIEPRTVQFLGGVDYQGSGIGIPAKLFKALSLVVGHTYVFFTAQDPSTPLCVVGGLRGLFSYDPATQTVSRLDHNRHSQIPRTMSLTQLESQINALEMQSEAAAAAAAPQQGPIKIYMPPTCATSATGL
jgi:hypothetical protein